MRYVVGYTPNERGADAIALAAAIARTQDAQLDVVYVFNEDTPYVSLTPDGEMLSPSEQAVLIARGKALKLVPEDVKAEFHVREAESFATGLIEAATEYEAGLIVIGAASNGLFKRFTVGSIANSLLHASPVPVALAPRGYQRKEGLSRLTLMVGTRQGAQEAIDVAIESAARRGLPLRLVSLLELDELKQEEFELDNPLSPARQHVNTVLAQAAAKLSESQATATLAHGRSIEEAIDSIGWDDGELVIFGSSRLAQKNLLFLGSTANKVLRALPVPMIVVPRDYERFDTLG
ncbi:nucleotide-binding universal stress UspA family protein [Psychromicrobium silvestre]|uniref:Nucleotide-binding universal stress UspA family protein n=1 Tax=Psychromicrobium silvestre TaxID=1645614 RepID=A0A7Y9S6I2_9MICC|nr:universal stress protein [Psychromicrobium silvestre]NYE95433.1 nucleotide-binding universal stress UspA family protein [Psychromicrobium silvestre]